VHLVLVVVVVYRTVLNEHCDAECEQKQQKDIVNMSSAMSSLRDNVTGRQREDDHHNQQHCDSLRVTERHLCTHTNSLHGFPREIIIRRRRRKFITYT